MPTSIDYVPGPVPRNPQDLPRYLEDELRKIQSVLRNLANGHMDKVTRAPSKPREGDIRLADGVHWDPLGVSASRFVGYRGGAWINLG